MIYKILIRPVLFLFNPESVHDFMLKMFSGFTFLYPVFRMIYSPSSNKNIVLGNLCFKNYAGLAAGFDKNGIALRFWEALGFSHAEVGTVTPLPQSGNEKPRLFRLKKDKALINRMGFNNDGCEKVRQNILNCRNYLSRDFMVGVNIGKNKDTHIKDALSDYKKCFETLFDAADYFTLNISSPNTEGLRRLHEENYLDELLKEIMNLNESLSLKFSVNKKPVFLKIAPDLNPEMIESVFRISGKNGVTGIIAANTTVQRPDLKTHTNEQGGLSGKPLKNMSNKVLKKLYELKETNLDYKPVLIGCGGIFDKKDAELKIKLGADLIQIYTGFIYEGPGILKKLVN